VGHPLTKPAIALEDAGDGTTVWVSWNGATQVARWQVLGGDDAEQLRPLASGAKGGFETAIRLPTRPRYVAARALDAKGAVLATSQVRGS
jgi:hypothetical protein